MGSWGGNFYLTFTIYHFLSIIYIDIFHEDF